jgi:hypothetical protein
MNDSPHRLALGQWLQILYWFVNPHRLIRISFVSVLVGLIGVAGTYGEPPVVPGTNQVVCYERIQPIFQVKSIPREQGDALLAALDGGRQTQEWTVPPGIEFPIPIPASIWLNVVLTNGSSYCIGFSSQGELVYLPDRLSTVIIPVPSRF